MSQIVAAAAGSTSSALPESPGPDYLLAALPKDRQGIKGP
jgi:hypothetical protein